MIPTLEAIKQAAGIQDASCRTCARLGADDDGNYPEYCVSWHICTKPGRSHVTNLKSFPFKTDQKCWEPEFWQSKYADMIKTGEDEEILRLIGEFRASVDEARRKAA